MQDNYIIYVQDTETTGLSMDNDIIEISFLRIQNKNFEQKTWLLKAVNEASIQDDALKVNGHKKEDILWKTQYGRENYKNPSDALFEIEEWINKDGMSSHDRVFAGQNPLFDFDRMVELWSRCNTLDTFPFITGHNKLIVDTKQLALFIDICLGVKRDRYNLGSLVKAFGVKKGTAHRADEDTRMTADLLVKFIDGMTPSIKQSFTDCK